MPVVADGHPAPEPVDPALEAMVRLAVGDAAERLGVPPDVIVVESAAVVTWPDAGLGCRRPGMRYPQVPVDGVRIVLNHAGRRYDYHAGGRVTTPFWCPRPG